MNDRFAETARYVAAGGLRSLGDPSKVCVLIDAELLATELADMASSGRMPALLIEWVREHARLGAGMSAACWEASNPEPPADDECLDCGAGTGWHAVERVAAYPYACTVMRLTPKTHAECVDDTCTCPHHNDHDRKGYQS